MDDNTHFANALALQGVDVPAARQGGVAQQLTRQITAERAATAGLEFEVEPAVFFQVLEASAK